jgi:hypothetical protein
MTVLKKFYETQARIFLNELNLKKVEENSKEYKDLIKQLKIDREELKRILNVVR